MKNLIKKWWAAGAFAVLVVAGFGLALGLARIAEARAEVPVLMPIEATGPHIAVWALGAPPAELGGIVTSPAADPIIVPDPVDNPSGFWDLLLWAKKNSWPLVIAILIAGVAATAGKRWTWLVQEGTRRAAVVGTLSMASAALLDALINGSWAPFAIAVVAGVFWIIDPKKKPKEAEPGTYTTTLPADSPFRSDSPRADRTILAQKVGAGPDALGSSGGKSGG